MNNLSDNPISWSRGHEIIYDYDKKDWFYKDDMTLYDDSRPCKRCGRYPNPDGSDACLGHIEGAISVCCGHGVSTPIIMFKEIKEREDE